MLYEDPGLVDIDLARAVVLRLGEVRGPLCILAHLVGQRNLSA